MPAAPERSERGLSTGFMRFGSWHKGRYIRFKLPVAHSGANFHARMDHRDGSNNLSAIVCSDAVTAAQGCVGAEYAQDSFNSSKTLFCALHTAHRRRDQSPLQLDKTITTHHEFAGWAACLQRGRDVEETAFVTVDLMREAPVQNFPRMIEPLLRVAHPV